MPPCPVLPPGTMIVYTHHLYFGLCGAAALGFIVGILFYMWLIDRQATIHIRKDRQINTIGRPGER